ncbi:pyridine nucleotide-disulfide oxidoreductase domain-containing protein [Ditylenchus destructor]|nr:pyridine nucleotide-disulfide oxidoreductase domain-containing protein [Ditylenchus destructor]
MVGRKDAVVKQNNDGILYLFKKNKVTFFHGRGPSPPPRTARMRSRSPARPKTIIAKHVIVATGSNARQLPGAPFDEVKILSNDGALRIPAVPKTLGVIGAGVIGLEMGSVWRRLGSEVTILEAMPEFLAAADESVAKEAAKVFKSKA